MSEILDIEDCDTLFLDRDGVINRHRPDDYVKSWDEFEFLPEIVELFPLLNKKFKRIIVVTNQRGVGKGVMTEANLIDIHSKMTTKIREIGGRIDKIYYCTDTNNDSPNRKPNIGMALQAKADFPEIDFSKSIMVGDSQSDIDFGKNAGMKTFLLKKKI
ncbi:MAG: D-glycero-alpha-D-manno-heptose-1,7-bisphosphate 7-phosphatase [Bacteroidales bacterium]